MAQNKAKNENKQASNGETEHRRQEVATSHQERLQSASETTV